MLRELGPFRQQYKTPLISESLSAGVRQRHVQSVTSFAENLPIEWGGLSLPVAAVKYFTQRAVVRMWRASTLEREMANFMGALSNLPCYSTAAIGIDLGKSREWKAAMASARHKTNEDQNREQPAATGDQIAAAAKNCNSPRESMALIFSWIFAGRVGDVLELETKHVTMDPATRLVKASFYRGKGVKFNQPYTLATTMPECWQEEATEYLEEARTRPTALLFPKCGPPLGPVLTAALRTINEDLGARAIRRGALQALADNGTDLEVVRTFAGHKRIETTYRYLNWNRNAAAQHAVAAEATLALEPRQASGAGSQ